MSQAVFNNRIYFLTLKTLSDEQTKEEQEKKKWVLVHDFKNNINSTKAKYFSNILKFKAALEAFLFHFSAPQRR